MSYKQWLNQLPVPHLRALASQVGIKTWRNGTVKNLTATLVGNADAKGIWSATYGA